MLESHNPTDHFEFTSHPMFSDFVEKEKEKKERKEIDKSENQELKQQNKINRKRKSINSTSEYEKKLKSLCLQDNSVITLEKLKLPTALSLTPLAQG